MKIQTLPIAIFLLLVQSTAAPAQQILNASGNLLAAPNMRVEYSIGEPVISTLLAGNEAATQGFVQPDYGADCALEQPIALPDLAVLNLPAGGNSALIMPFANDVLPDGAVFSLEITTDPTQGSATTSGGDILIFDWPMPDTGGVDSFAYRVCVVGCPNLCDTAWVKILTETEKRYFSNVLTPEPQDGKNDVFDPVFDLERRPENAGRRVAEAELSIHNRWGERVFYEKSVSPKWSGFSPGGQPMPQATYYFVLRAVDFARVAFSPELGTVTVLR